VGEPSRFLLEIPEDQLHLINARRPEPVHAPPVSEPAPDDDFPFRLGAKLRHARWGEGLLVGIQREGAAVLATVHFASVGRKRLSLQYAHLEEI
jgi:DNA helicase-2/ATP-dependent DNA helicase PcrA